MRYLSLAEVLELYRRVMAQTGGAFGLRDLGALESAVGQPRQTFGGEGSIPRSGRRRQCSGSVSSRIIPS